MIQFEGYTIDDSRGRGKINFKTTCPRCLELGKKNHKDTCLSVNTTDKLFNCHKCGWKGFYGEKYKPEEKTYKKVDIGNLTALIDSHLQEFSRRGITQRTVLRNAIQTAKNGYYAFPYYEGEEVVNVKYRKAGEKRFMQAPDAKATMYKYNDIIGQKKIIICEGEFDALAWEEAGYLFATSVNQGAPNVNDANVEKKLECVYNCFDIFEQAEEIYLSVDNDPNGQRLQKELIKMFTAEKIRLIDHGDQKDANDVLLKHGKEALVSIFENAKEIPQEGVFGAKDFYDDIYNDYLYGQPLGTTTHFLEVDTHWKHREGEVTIWTGYNNEGKSLFLKQLFLIKSKFEGWKHGFFTPEEMPFNEWYTDLIESYIGKSADVTQKKFGNYMSHDQLIAGYEFVNKHFFVVYPEENQTLEKILKRFSYLIRKNNLKTITIDPYNQVQHLMESGEREDLYISKFMTRLKKFAVQHEVCVHLVAHQNTPMNPRESDYPKPNIFSIKGGGTFSDKADNVVSIWRPHRNTDYKDTSVKFIAGKIKKQKLVGVPGECGLVFNRSTNRYYGMDGSPLDTKSEQLVIPNSELESNFNERDAAF